MSITEQPIGEVSAPTDLTEATEVATSTPVNLTEQATGSVAIPSTITPESIPTTNPSGAIIGYNNVLLSATITGDTTTPESALTKNTWERWRPTATTVTARFRVGNVDTDINYIAIAAHNLIGETITVKTDTVEGTAIGSMDLVETITPTSNQPIFLTFSTRTIREVAITATFSSQTEIGVIYAGIYMQMPVAVYGGHTPMTLSQDTDYRDIQSDTGQFLGRSIVRQGLNGNFSWQYIEPDWYRDTFQPFVIAARTSPFFIKWRPDYYEDEIAFGYSTKDFKPTNMGGGHRLMSVSMSMRGHSDA
jgi:hypothetical protein